MLCSMAKTKLKTDFNDMSWRKRKKLGKGDREKKLLEQLGKVKQKEVTENNSETTKEQVEQQSTSLQDKPTISIAIPGSILDNAQSLELRTYLAGQVARAAAVFRVDEIVVFDESAKMTDNELEQFYDGSVNFGEGPKPNCNFLLARLLQYLETPQYLRKKLFPLQTELKYAGLLNPLDCPHHLRSHDLSIPYREAVVLQKPAREKKGSYCDAGLAKEVQIDRHLEPGIRVTVELLTFDLSRRKLNGKVVSPSEPSTKNGLYWGYQVRIAKSLSHVFDLPSYSGGYDITIGTSEKGTPIDQCELPQFRHALIVFGGLSGLESCLENDQSLTASDPSELFNFYLNTCPEQGSRTIRTEEALLITLSALKVTKFGNIV